MTILPCFDVLKLYIFSGADILFFGRRKKKKIKLSHFFFSQGSISPPNERFGPLGRDTFLPPVGAVLNHSVGRVWDHSGCPCRNCPQDYVLLCFGSSGGLLGPPWWEPFRPWTPSGTLPRSPGKHFSAIFSESRFGP